MVDDSAVMRWMSYSSTRRSEGERMKYKVISGKNDEEFEKKLNNAETEINATNGKVRFIQTSTAMAGNEALTFSWGAVIMYDEGEPTPEPEATYNPETKPCPGCGEPIPVTAEKHLKCGWGEEETITGEETIGE